MYLDYNHRDQGWGLVYDEMHPVPEPGSLVLLGIGMVGLALGISRNKNRH